MAARLTTPRTAPKNETAPETPAETPAEIPAETPAETPVADGEGTDPTPETAPVDSGEEATDEAPDPFASLDEVLTEEAFKRGPVAKDYEKLTSPRVKGDLAKSYEKFTYARTADGTVLDKGHKPYWLTQKFPTTAMALAYFEQAKHYAKFKGWTLRSGWMIENSEGTLMRSEGNAPSTILRFTAKPGEKRGGAGNTTAR